MLARGCRRCWHDGRTIPRRLSHEQLAAAAELPSEATGAESRNPFRTADYRAWWLASVTGALGTGIATVSVPLFVRDRVAEDERAAAIAAALFAQAAPSALLILVGGVVADRKDRRRVLSFAYLLAMAASFSYALLSGNGVDAIWPVLILAAMVGSSNAFANPARQSMVPQMISRTQLQNGIIMGTVAFMASLQFGGPTIGGLIADGPGLTAAFMVEGCLLACCALLFTRLKYYPSPKTGKTILADLREGVAYARSTPVVRDCLVMSTLPGIFFIGPMNVNMVLMVEDVFEASDKFVGLLFASFGAGLVACSLLLMFLKVPRRGLMLALAPIHGGLFFVLFGLNESLPLAMLILFFFGNGAAVFINYAITLLQENTTPMMMGRVMSMYTLAFLASGPFGFVMAGVLASTWGPQTSIVVAGIGVALVGLFVLTRLRTLRTLP